MGSAITTLSMFAISSMTQTVKLILKRLKDRERRKGQARRHEMGKDGPCALLLGGGGSAPHMPCALKSVSSCVTTAARSQPKELPSPPQWILELDQAKGLECFMQSIPSPPRPS